MIFNYIKLVTIVCLVAWGCKTEREGVEFTLTVTTETRPQNKLFVFYRGANDSIRVDSVAYERGHFVSNQALTQSAFFLSIKILA